MQASRVATVVLEPRRRDILRLVWDRERSAGEIHEAVREITFGAVSQHLRRLEEAGAVTCRKEGRYRYYTAQRKQLGAVGRLLESLWDEKLTALKKLAENAEERR